MPKDFHPIAPLRRGFFVLLFGNIQLTPSITYLSNTKMVNIQLTLPTEGLPSIVRIVLNRTMFIVTEATRSLERWTEKIE